VKGHSGCSNAPWHPLGWKSPVLAACRLTTGTVQACDYSDIGDGVSQPSEMEKEENPDLNLLQPCTFMCALYFAVMGPWLHLRGTLSVY